MMEFSDALKPSGEYCLSDVTLELKDGEAIFYARLCGPTNAKVWMRAWISDEFKTLSETASDALAVGDAITLAVAIPDNLPAEGTGLAAIRIESAPLQTEHVLIKPLQFSQGKFIEPT